MSAGVKDGVPVNGSCWDCRLSCLLDLSPARRIGVLVICIDFVGKLFASFVFVCVHVPSGVMRISIPNNKRHFVVAEEMRYWAS